ncbi:hypothetical protein M5G07_12900 [Serratia symbiotica]|nr:hypothetical protein [Serratia symbiotica]
MASNIFDTLTLPVIYKSESNNISNRIVNLSCLNSIFTYVNKSSDGSFKAITKMAKMQGIASADPDYGVKYLRNVLKDQFTKGKIKHENIRVSVIEVGI